jgi:hypothetical protein
LYFFNCQWWAIISGANFIYCGGFVCCGCFHGKFTVVMLHSYFVVVHVFLVYGIAPGYWFNYFRSHLTDKILSFPRDIRAALLFASFNVAAVIFNSNPLRSDAM